MNTVTILKNEMVNYKGKASKQQVIIKNKNDKNLDMSDVKQLARMLSEKFKKSKGKEPRMLIRARGKLGVFCIKDFDESIDNMFENEEDYLKGRNKDTTKYKEYDQIEILMYEKN